MFSNIIRTYRQSFAGLSRQTWWLSLVILINRSGTMVAPFLTMYLTLHLHYSLTQAGIVNASLGLGSISGALIGGRLTDKYGHIGVQLAALFGGGILFILLGYTTHFGLICLVTFILSLVNDAFRPANSAAIAEYSAPENRTRSYSLNRLAINIGWSVGATIGGVLAGISYKILFWVDGITNLAAAVLLWQVLFRKNVKKYKETKVEMDLSKASPWRDGPYMRFIFISILFFSCFMLMFRIVPVYYQEKLHLSEPVIGAVMGLNGIIIALIEMVLVSKLESRGTHLMFIRFGLYLGAISFLALLLPLPALLLSIFVMVIFTFSEILALPFMNSFWISRTNANNRGSYAAVYTLCWSVAQVTGPYIGGLVVDNSNYTVLWVGSFIVSLGCGLAMYSLKNDKKEMAVTPALAVQEIDSSTE